MTYKHLSSDISTVSVDKCLRIQQKATKHGVLYTGNLLGKPQRYWSITTPDLQWSRLNKSVTDGVNSTVASRVRCR